MRAEQLLGEFFSLLCLLTGAACGVTAAALPLDTLFARGDSSLAVSWTPDSSNTRTAWYLQNGATCTGVDSIYRHSDFLPGVTYNSIAYSYGGEDSYWRFKEKVEQGLLVGSHLCHYTTFGDPTPVVAGTDCSGFVCYLWGVPRVSTNGLKSAYEPQSWDNLSAGDVLVKPGSHAVMVVEREDSTHLLIWESTSVVNGCRERSIDITESSWSSYYPLKYPTSLLRQPENIHSLHATMPRISFINKALTINSLTGWHGTVALYNASGKREWHTVCSLKPAGREMFQILSASGLVLFRFESADGSIQVTPLFVGR